MVGPRGRHVFSHSVALVLPMTVVQGLQMEVSTGATQYLELDLEAHGETV